MITCMYDVIQMTFDLTITTLQVIRHGACLENTYFESLIQFVGLYSQLIGEQ